MAADLRVGDQAASTTPEPVWRWLGGLWQRLGGRWGGTFAVGFAGGPTPDLNHFELPTSGPTSSSTKAERRAIAPVRAFSARDAPHNEVSGDGQPRRQRRPVALWGRSMRFHTTTGPGVGATQRRRVVGLPLGYASL